MDITPNVYAHIWTDNAPTETGWMVRDVFNKVRNFILFKFIRKNHSSKNQWNDWNSSKNFFNAGDILRVTASPPQPPKNTHSMTGAEESEAWCHALGNNWQKGWAMPRFPTSRRTIQGKRHTGRKVLGKPRRPRVVRGQYVWNTIHWEKQQEK